MFGTEFKVCDTKNPVINFSSKTWYYKLQRIRKKKKLKPTIIVNSSAIVGINQCEIDYEKAFAVNSIGALNLAKIWKYEYYISATSTHAVLMDKNNTTLKKIIQNLITFIVDLNIYLKNLWVLYEKYIIRFPTLLVTKNKLLGFVDKVILALENNKKLMING